MSNHTPKPLKQNRKTAAATIKPIPEKDVKPSKKLYNVYGRNKKN